MLFNPFTNSTRSKKPFHVVEQISESEQRSRSADQEPTANFHKANNDSSRPGSSQSTGSSGRLTDTVIKTGHWVAAGPGVLIKPLEEKKGKQALQISLTQPLPDTFQEELREAGS